MVEILQESIFLFLKFILGGKVSIGLAHSLELTIPKPYFKQIVIEIPALCHQAGISDLFY